MGSVPSDPPGAVPDPDPTATTPRWSAPWRSRPALLVGALALLAFAIRLPTAGEQSFWLDEVYTGRIVDGSLGHVWSTIQETENTPPLFYLLDWVVGRLFGTGELALRSLSALAGALAVVPVVALARRVGGGTTDDDAGASGAPAAAMPVAGRDTPGTAPASSSDPATVPAGSAGRARRFAEGVVGAVGRGTAAPGVAVPTAVALGAGALLAVNPLGHWFGQEARSYALFVLLTTIAWVALLAAAQDPTRRRLWLWALAAVAGAWTHYFGGLLFVVGWAMIALVLWGRGSGLRALRPMALPAVVSSACVAAMAPIAANQQSTEMYQAISLVKGLGSRIVETPKQFVIGYSAPGEVVVGVVLILVVGALVLAGAWPRDGRATRGTVLLGLVAAVWLLPMVALAGGFDVVLTRNFVLLIPPLVVLAALGAWRLGSRALVVLGVVGVVQLATIVLVALLPVYQREDWRGLFRAAQDGQPTPELFFIDQYQGPAATYYSPTLKVVPVDRFPVVARSVATVDRLRDQEPLDAIDPPPPPAGFTLDRVEQRDQWRVFVWTAPKAIPVDPYIVNLWRSQPPRALLMRR